MNAFFFGLLIVTVSMSSANAAKCTARLKTGMNIDSAFYKRHASGQTTGVAFDIVQALGERSGCEFQTYPVNFARAFEDFKYSRMDVFAIVFPNPQWASVAEHRTLYQSDRILLFAKDKAPSKRELADLMKDKKVKFGSVIGAVLFFSPEEQALLEKDKRIVEAPDADGAVKLLLAGKVQVMFASPVFMNYLRQSQDINQFISIVDDKNPINIGIYVSKRRVPEAQKHLLFKAVDEMRADGSIKKIMSKYVRPEDLHHYR